MNHLIRSSVTLAAALVTLCPLNAAPITLQIPPGAGGSGPGGFAGWTISYEPLQNGNTLTVGPFSPITNVLQITEEFKNFNPIVITFIENPVITTVPNPIPGLPPIVKSGPPSANSGVSGGINILLQKKVKNSTTENWKSFTLQIIDLAKVDPASVPAGGAKNEHPVFPHFHDPAPAFPSFGKFTPFNAKDFIALSNGPYPIGFEGTWTGVRLHNREVKDKLRSFHLVERPFVANIPEPSTMALYGVAALFLIGHGRRRRNAV